MGFSIGSLGEEKKIYLVDWVLATIMPVQVGGLGIRKL